MATPYDENLPTDKDKIRFLTGDTDDDHQMLADGEIAYLLTQENDDVLLAAAYACEAIAAKFARDVNFRFSTMWQDSSDAYDHYIELAGRFRTVSQSNTVSPVFTFGPGVNEDAPEIFWYGIHDNPPAPQTDS